MAYRGTRRSKVKPILFSIAVLLGVAWFVAGMPLSSATEAWRAGDYDAAMAALDRGSKFRLRPAEYDHVYAATHLAAGRADEAARYLDASAGRTADWFAPISKSDVGERLISQGAYSEFLRYDTAIDEKRSDANLALYRAAAYLGSGDLDMASNVFGTIDQSAVDSERYDALRTGLDQRESGSYPLLLDRSGETIASWQIGNEDLVAVDSNFDLLADERGGATSFEANIGEIGTSRTVVTTLDAQIQRAARAALGSRRGSIVVIDTSTHEILAAASSAGDGEPRNLAFGGMFEPGSIMKVLTQINAIDSGVALEEIFPLECGGFIVLDGRQFFDWARHGTVDDEDEAMAVSCNVAYGRMGLALGAEEILEFVREAGFGKGVDLGLFSVGLGTIVGDPLTDFQTANLGIGLEHYRINALHVAMLADAIANGGVLHEPTLVRSYLSVLGDETEHVDEPAETRLASAEAVQRTIDSMEAVVNTDTGTGRRARVESVDYAIKTGTAGDRPYEAVILGIVPAESPRFAFGIIAENVGPAEYEGAAITRALVERIHDRAVSAE